MGVPDERAPYIAEEVHGGREDLRRLRVCSSATTRPRSACGPTGRPAPFVHIATHGSFRRDNPMFSSIRLGSGPTERDSTSISSACPAELVTLSGCGTGLNAIVGGDELLGLVRGLLYAGRPRGAGDPLGRA